MPFDTYDGPLPAGMEPVMPEADYSMWDVAVAGFSRESDVIGDGLNLLDPIPRATEEDDMRSSTGQFSATEYLKGTKFDTPELRPIYAQYTNKAQVDWQMRRHEREYQQLQTIDNHPYASLLPQMAGGIFRTTRTPTI